MSEIEKMYNNVGIKVIRDNAIGRGYYIEHQRIEEHPPFTAEKQLKLIKWCLDNYRRYIFDSIETEWFEEQLCAFINNIWQDLTEEEKQQVKGILK